MLQGVLFMNRRILALVLTVLLLLGTVVAPVGASAASKSKVKILKVTVDGARVRKGPSSAYDIITSVKKGTKVFYLNKMKSSFAYICTDKGVTGYMYRGFLESYGVAYKYQVYYSTKGGVGVYKRTSANSTRVARLSKKQHVIVYQVKGSWAYIKTLGGTGGYVKKSNLKKA